AVARHALVLVEIQVDAVGLDVPGWLDARAAAVLHGGQAHLRAAEDLGALGAGRAAAGADPEIGRFDLAAVGIDIELRRGAGDQGAVAHQPRIALDVDGAGVAAVIDAVALGHAVDAAHFGGAGQGDVGIGVALHVVGLQVGGDVVVGQPVHAQARRSTQLGRQPQAVIGGRGRAAVLGVVRARHPA